MRYSDDRHHLTVEIVGKNCEIPADERERMQSSLVSLGELVQDLPGAELQVQVIFHPHTAMYHVEFKLQLPGEPLFADKNDVYLDTAFQHCLEDMRGQVPGYQRRLAPGVVEASRRRLALNRDVVPEDLDGGRLAQAVHNGDFRNFRAALAGYDDWLNKRIGRWVQRYPEVEARIGRGLLLSDIAEEIYLNAYDHFSERPADVRLSDWLEALIDPSLKTLLRHPDEEMENIRIARTVSSE
jgi:ribosome-associated translation inhibitor RaiA